MELPDKTATPNLLAIARQRLAAVEPFLSAQRDADVDTVHDLRVLTRRLAEVARLAEPLMDETAAAALVHALRNLRQSTGELRDLDVMTEYLEKWRFPAELGAVREEILAEVPARRAELVTALRRELESPAMLASLAFFRRVLDEGAANRDAALPAMEKALRKTTRRRRKGLEEKLGTAARKQTQTAFHAGRIAIKKLRYSLELADESGIASHGSELKFFKKFQGQLGDMHDVEVIMQLLRARVQARVEAQPGLAAAWDVFERRTHIRQGRQAAKALVRSVLWMNGIATPG